MVAGGCPILNTAIEADDTNPELRDRARHSMTLWHRLIGRIVKDGKAAGTVRADVDPYDLASLLTASLEGGVMLSRLYDDGAYMDRVIAHFIDHIETLRPQRARSDRSEDDCHDRTPDLPTQEGVRTRTITWTDPARGRFALRGKDGLDQLPRSHAATRHRRPIAAVLGIRHRRGANAAASCSPSSADEMHENPMGTMHGGIVATLVDSAMGCAVFSMLPAGTAYTTLELKTNYVRPIVQNTGVVRAEGRVVHIGGRVATTEARVVDADGTLYAHATSTCLITRPKGGVS